MSKSTKSKKSVDSAAKSTPTDNLSRRRDRSIPPLKNPEGLPLTPAGYDPSPILYHPSLRATGGERRKAREWYEFITSTKDYEEAWIAFRDNMNEALFERMAIATPYLRDAIFYNLNAAILKQKRSKFHKLPLFQPAGPLHRLCEIVTPSVYEQISTARPKAVGPWLMSSYRDKMMRLFNGVIKEIELEIDTIYRSVNDDIPSGAYKVNMETLEAIWSFDYQGFLQDVAKSPLSPFDDSVFENIFQSDEESKVPEDFVPVATSTPTKLNRAGPLKSTPRAPPKPKQSSLEKLGLQKKLKSLYVIHELIYAESVAITVRVGNTRETHHPTNFLRGKRAYPIGFTLTKYKIDQDGWLEKKEVIRGSECIDDGWNVVSNIPWPMRPPEPLFLVPENDRTLTKVESSKTLLMTENAISPKSPQASSSQLSDKGSTAKDADE